MNLKKFGTGLTIIALLAVTLPSCKSQAQKDAEAKTKIEASLSSGVTVEVNDGVATLNGNFPDEVSKTAAEDEAKKVMGIKSVVNNATVTPEPEPIVVSPDESLMNSVDAVLKDYPGVSAQVSNGIVTLTGTISKSNLQNLMQTVNSLHPGKVENKLTIK